MQRKAAEKRICELEKIASKLYEDNALGKISDEKYAVMSQGYDNELSALKQKQITLSEQIEKANEVYENVDSFVTLINSHTQLTELNTRVLNEFIDRIVVREKTENADGSKSQRVDIYYKFVGCIDIIPAA